MYVCERSDAATPCERLIFLASYNHDIQAFLKSCFLGGCPWCVEKRREEKKEVETVVWTEFPVKFCPQCGKLGTMKLVETKTGERHIDHFLKCSSCNWQVRFSMFWDF